MPALQNNSLSGLFTKAIDFNLRGNEFGNPPIQFNNRISLCPFRLRGRSLYVLPVFRKCLDMSFITLSSHNSAEVPATPLNFHTLILRLIIHVAKNSK
jgi:hypothetical protein